MLPSKNIVRSIQIYILFAFICILFGCSGSKKPKEKEFGRSVISVHIEEFNSTMDISTSFKMKFILLEATSASLIGDIDKAIVTGDYIFVLDVNKSRKLFMFDKNGKFIRTIGKQGRGPSEYSMLVDFDVHENRVFLSSKQTNKILIYDFQGNCIDEIKSEGYIGNRFCILRDNKFIIKDSDGSNKTATFYSNKGRRLKTIGNPSYSFLRKSTNLSFTKFDDEVFMFFALNDTIYKIDDKNETLQPEFLISFGEKTFPICDIKDKRVLEKQMNLPFFHLENFIIANNNYYMEIYDNKYNYFVLVNKTDSSTLYANKITYKNIPLARSVGNTRSGPILMWDPNSIAILEDRNKIKYEFIPHSKYQNGQFENIGIAIITENDEKN